MNFIDPETSFITFGGVDHKYIDSAHSLTYYNIKDEKFSYEVDVKHVKFGNEIFNIETGLLDSGNTCVSIAAEYTDHMLKEMNQGGNECQFEKESGNDIFKILSCVIHDFDALPLIEVEMPDDKVFTWEKEYYLDKCAEDISSTEDKKVYKCYTFIESVESR